MERFRQLFGHVNRLIVIGMIHVRALPGTPRHRLTINEIVEKSCQEAEIYKKHKLDAVLIENMHDVPYLKGEVGPEIVSSMTRVCSEVKRVIGMTPLGVQILAGANKEAIAVACSSGGQFVRVEGFVFSHVADEGWIDACSGELMRYRRLIGSNDVLVFTDIKKKHSSHSITRDVSLIDTAKAAEFFTSDGVILTGSHTGDPTSPKHLYDVKRHTSLPVIIGSGVTVDNMNGYKEADGVIVGSHFKKDGLWNNEIEEQRVEKFMMTLTT